jgi:hypothetical protein
MRIVLIIVVGVLIVGAVLWTVWMRWRSAGPKAVDRRLVEPGLASPPRDQVPRRTRWPRRKRHMDPRANGHSRESEDLR